MQSETLLEERRRYNREYMRMWRSDPENRRRECLSRTRWDAHRKLQSTRVPANADMTTRGKPTCGLCHLRAPVCHVMRLRILPSGEFKQVRVPYCGQC